MITEDALAALTAKLAAQRRRDDVKILAVTGMRAGWFPNWITLAPGIGIDVTFTYTSGRTYRRQAVIGWPLTEVPEPVIEMLSTAVAQPVTEPARRAA